MTAFSKNLDKIAQDLAQAKLPATSASGQPEAEIPLDDAGRALAEGEGVLAEGTAPQSLAFSPDDVLPGSAEVLDLALVAYSPLGVSFGQMANMPTSFGSGSTGLFALVQANDDGIGFSALSGCSCPGCLSGSGGNGNGDGAPGPAVSLQSLADYLRVTFWNDFGGFTPQYFNVTNSGTGANNGQLLYNVTGTPAGGVATYFGTYTDTNGVAAARATLIRDAFAYYEELLGIDFVETTSTGTEVDFFFIDNQSGAFEAPQYFAGKGGPIDVAVINVNSGWQGGTSNFADYTYQTFLHEIGHALGLGHQGLYNAGSGSPTYANSALFANDSWAQSMMSYWDQVENTEYADDSYAFLAGPSAADFIALNDLYSVQGFGINNAFNGNTIYGVGTNITTAQNRQFNALATLAATNAFTITDADGYDTVDFSNYNVDQTINLTVTLASDTRATRSSVGGLNSNMMLAVGTVIEAAIGGGGNDFLVGNEYNNTLTGNAGGDNMWGEGGDDYLYGGVGNDTLKGGAGNDFLYGGNNNDYLKGGAGNDYLYGGSGVDSLEGEAGADRLYVLTTAGLTGATFDGGADSDALVLSSAASTSSQWNLRNSSLIGLEEIEFFADGTNSAKSIQITGAQAVGLGAAAMIDGNDNSGSSDSIFVYLADSSTTTLNISGWVFQDWNASFGIQDYIYIYGGAAAETVTGSSQIDYIYGGDGNDYLSGGGGADYLYGDDANDSLYGGDGDDQLYGGNGNDHLDGGAGTDQMEGGHGNDNLFGSDGSDTIFGGYGNDTIDGWYGDDYLVGDDGDDQILGWDGNDTFFGGKGTDTLYGEDGDDYMVSYNNGGLDNYYGGDGSDIVDLSFTKKKYVVDLANGTYSVGAVSRAMSSVEHVYTGSGVDLIHGSASANYIYTGARNDVIYGGGGLDTIFGGSGADIIYSGSAADSLYGGVGNDRIYLTADLTNSSHVDGGAGSDWLDLSQRIGGATVDVNLGTYAVDVLSGTAVNILNVEGTGSSDAIYGNSGQNRLNGGDGDDVLEGRGGKDTLRGGTGNDTMNGGDGDDSMVGGFGNDSMFGGAGNDTVYGDNGNDYITGLAGNDLLYGGVGVDTLFGGTGTDTLWGGSGADRFVFNNATEIGLGAASDRIEDFTSGQDKIDLSNFVTALTFIGTSAFTGVAGQVRTYSLGGLAYLAGDTSGNGLANFEIVIGNNVLVAAGDLIL